MKYLLLTISCLIGFISCQQEYIPQKDDLDFDELIHYHHKELKWSKHSIDGTEYPNATNDEKLLDTLGFKKEIYMRDTIHIKNFERLGYQKNIVLKNKFNSIKAILNGNNGEGIEEACTKIYQDILVLKKKSRINSIIKICFRCDSIIIAEINGMTYLSISYENQRQLNKILNRK